MGYTKERKGASLNVDLSCWDINIKGLEGGGRDAFRLASRD